MQESGAVRDAVVRFYERIGAGREAWLESVRENTEMGVRFEGGDVRAFAEGDAGWAVDEPTIVLPNGMRLQTRMTAVLRREPDGEWRLLHQHYSWAVPDEVAMERATAWREQLGSRSRPDPRRRRRPTRHDSGRRRPPGPRTWTPRGGGL